LRESLKRLKMIDFSQIDKARKILELGEFATSEEIDKSYRRLAKKFHPDRCPPPQKKECESRFKEITFSYRLLKEYISSYRYSFKEEDVRRNSFSPQAYEHLKKFYDGWWGDLGF